MGNTRFSGPVSTRTVEPSGAAGSYTDEGFVVLSQQVHIVQAGAATTDYPVYLPANSSIVAFYVDTKTAWDSATSAALTIGTASTGTQYVSSTSLKATAGRQALTLTGAQVGAMANIGSNVEVFVTVAAVGATTAGEGWVTILYVQNP